jgi:PIN domain nuclease of toxin-antitoxin system
VSPTSHRVTLDASAVLAWVLHERGFETIDRVLPIAVVPVSAMVEVLYRAVERGHALSTAQLHSDLLALGLTLEPVTDADAERAAELIVSSKAAPGPGSLSLGDGLCIAVAERLALPLTGGDTTYWSQVPLQVEFLPFR